MLITWREMRRVILAATVYYYLCLTWWTRNTLGMTRTNHLSFLIPLPEIFTNAHDELLSLFLCPTSRIYNKRGPGRMLQMPNLLRRVSGKLPRRNSVPRSSLALNKLHSFQCRGLIASDNISISNYWTQTTKTFQWAKALPKYIKRILSLGAVTTSQCRAIMSSEVQVALLRREILRFDVPDVSP